MTTKEKIKSEIDKMPDKLVEEVYEFINNIKTSKVRQRQLHTFKLQGKFDKIDIREMAHE